MMKRNLYIVWMAFSLILTFHTLPVSGAGIDTGKEEMEQNPSRSTQEKAAQEELGSKRLLEIYHQAKLGKIPYLPVWIGMSKSEFLTFMDRDDVQDLRNPRGLFSFEGYWFTYHKMDIFVNFDEKKCVNEIYIKQLPKVIANRDLAVIEKERNEDVRTEEEYSRISSTSYFLEDSCSLSLNFNNGFLDSISLGKSKIPYFEKYSFQYNAARDTSAQKKSKHKKKHSSQHVVGDAAGSVQKSDHDLKRTHHVVANGVEVIKSRKSEDILKQLQENMGSSMTIEPRFMKSALGENNKRIHVVDGFLEEAMCVIVNGSNFITTRRPLEIVQAVKNNFENHIDIKPLSMCSSTGNSSFFGSVAFSPDGKTVASGFGDGTITLVDVETGNELKRFENGSRVNSMVFSADGRKIVAGLGFIHGKIKVWDVKKGYVKRAYPSDDLVGNVAFHPTNKGILVSQENSLPGSDGHIVLWNMKTGEKKDTGVYNTGSFCFSPDGTKIAYESYDTITLADVQTGEKLKLNYFTQAEDSIKTIAFSPDGNRVASGDLDHNIEIWDLQKKEKLTTIKAGGMVFSICFSPDGKSIASEGDSNTIQLWDVETGKMLQRFVGHSRRMNCIAFNHDGTRLVSGSGDHTVKMWDVKTEKMLWSH